MTNNARMNERPPFPSGVAMTSVEAATWALVAETRLGKHGQLCPIWTKRAYPWTCATAGFCAKPNVTHRRHWMRRLHGSSARSRRASR